MFLSTLSGGAQLAFARLELMRKAIVVVVAVAILGVISIFNSKHQNATSSTGTSINPSSQVATNTATTTSTASTPATPTSYKDGTFTGTTEYNPYGPVQVAAVVSGGKIVDIKFLQMPSDERESQQRTTYAEPYLKQSAIDKQSANIDFVSGATDTSQTFEQSLQSALNQAAIS